MARSRKLWSVGYYGSTAGTHAASSWIGLSCTVLYLNFLQRSIVDVGFGLVSHSSQDETCVGCGFMLGSVFVISVFVIL